MTLFLRLGDNYIHAEGDAAVEEWAANEWRGLVRWHVEKWLRETEAELRKARQWLKRTAPG